MRKKFRSCDVLFTKAEHIGNRRFDMLKRHLSFHLALACAITLSLVSMSSAETCFYCSRKWTEDAQNLRLHVLDMGWDGGKPTSLTVASVIEGKANLYPKGMLRCV